MSPPICDYVSHRGEICIFSGKGLLATAYKNRRGPYTRDNDGSKRCIFHTSITRTTPQVSSKAGLLNAVLSQIKTENQIGCLDLSGIRIPEHLNLDHNYVKFYDEIDLSESDLRSLRIDRINLKKLDLARSRINSIEHETALQLHNVQLEVINLTHANIQGNVSVKLSIRPNTGHQKTTITGGTAREFEISISAESELSKSTLELNELNGKQLTIKLESLAAPAIQLKNLNIERITSNYCNPPVKSQRF